MRSNCFAYAIRQFWREGGYLVIEWSRWGWWTHARWSPDLARFYAFVPLRRPRKRRFPPLWFKGFIRKESS